MDFGIVWFMTAFAMETDIPDYDMDSEDENWVNSHDGKCGLTPIKVWYY